MIKTTNTNATSLQTLNFIKSPLVFLKQKKGQNTQNNVTFGTLYVYWRFDSASRSVFLKHQTKQISASICWLEAFLQPTPRSVWDAMGLKGESE